MPDKPYFVLFSNCIPVEGAMEAAICDMQYGQIIKVPSELVPILDKTKQIKKEDYSIFFDVETINALTKYQDFLQEEEFGFWTNSPEWFPTLSEEWDHPSIISNAVVEVDRNTMHLPTIIKQLDALSCKALEFRVQGKNLSHSLIEEVLNTTKNTSIQCVHLYVDNLLDFSEDYWKLMIIDNPRIYAVYCFGSNKSSSFEFEGRVVNNFKSNFSNKCCGMIDKIFFAVNIPMYTESLHHNSCLNRKISIDAAGVIRNCPSMKESFGNIMNITLAEAIEIPEFKKYWNINKDKIHVCKDCEFRYICTDCRAFVEDAEDILSKPLKCGYNPYEGVWSEWSTNPLKQKAIDFYDKREMI